LSSCKFYITHAVRILALMRQKTSASNKIQLITSVKPLHDLAPHQFALLQVAALSSDREICCTVASVDVGIVRLKAAK
jgi:hypothetical protein